MGALASGVLSLKSKAKQLAFEESKREDEAYSDTFILNSLFSFDLHFHGF